MLKILFMRAQPTTPRRDGSTRRRSAVLLILLLAIALLSAASLAFGTRAVPLSTLPDALLHPSPDNPWDQRIISELRLPRTVLALVVGAALGVAGALVQGHTRNPLADPGLLGVNAGAALAVVIGFTWLGATTVLATSVLALIGALMATVLVFAVAQVVGNRSDPLTLVLAGAALTAVVSSATTAIVFSSSNNLDRMRMWTVGSLIGRDGSFVSAMTPALLVVILLALCTAPQLNSLALGEDVAESLGISVTFARALGIGLIAILAGISTAAAGPIGFVGLLVPHVMRSTIGPDYRWLLPSSALAGAILLLASDIVGRLIAHPGEVQVGIVVAFVGAPVFIAMMARRRLVRP